MEDIIKETECKCEGANHGPSRLICTLCVKQAIAKEIKCYFKEREDYVKKPETTLNKALLHLVENIEEGLLERFGLEAKE